MIPNEFFSFIFPKEPPKKPMLWKVSIIPKRVLLTEAVLSGAGKESGIMMCSGLPGHSSHCTPLHSIW